MDLNGRLVSLAEILLRLSRQSPAKDVRLVADLSKVISQAQKTGMDIPDNIVGLLEEYSTKVVDFLKELAGVSSAIDEITNATLSDSSNLSEGEVKPFISPLWYTHAIVTYLTTNGGRASSEEVTDYLYNQMVEKGLYTDDMNAPEGKPNSDAPWRSQLRRIKSSLVDTGILVPSKGEWILNSTDESST